MTGGKLVGMSYRGDQRIRRLVLDRAEGYCEVSGRPLGDVVEVHHRRPGGHGGTARPGQHDASNLLALRPEVHNMSPDSVHGAPTWSRPRGYLLPTSCPSPAVVPVLLHGQRWVWLTDDGEYRDVPAGLLGRAADAQRPR
jgi:hypothetical protein